MTLQRRIRVGLAVALLALSCTASARAADAPTRVVPANVTDARINPTRGSHHVWLASNPARRVGKLLVFMGGGGVTNLPQDWSEIGSEAGRLGYHAIVLAYSNEAPVAALPPVGCGNDVDPPASPLDCAFNARMEILDGRGESTVVNVDRPNSIEYRLTNLLQHLAATYPAEGWSQFIDTSGLEPAPMWSQTVISGQSLGAAQAVLIGMLHEVHRVAAFAGWADAKHGWVVLGKTPSSRQFTLNHLREGLFERTCYAYAELGLAASCPLVNPPLVDDRQPPFGTRQLVHDLDPFTLDGVNDPYLTSTTRDPWIAREPDGTPSRKLVNAWRSTLGDSDGDTFLDQADNCPAVANATQTDSDKNGTGDACGPTVAAGAVGGTVPATLALTMGTAATFGAFTPGLDRTYDATTTATVVSTAGDAMLAVSDLGTAATGRLVNGAIALTEPLQAGATGTFAALPTTLRTFPAPVSNAVTTITFRQHIGATQALRTGAYAKTLTFTLSTTTP
jgi:hypothetical protein